MTDNHVLIAGYAVIIVPIVGWLLRVEHKLGKIEEGLKAVHSQLSLLSNKLL